jgi:ribose-phosphate pyrophosphokinase
LAIGGESGQLALRDFPDGETYLRIDSDVTDRDVAVVATLRHPNEKFLPLAFLLNTIRECGARRVGLVAPYLAYMRQDKRFQRGEAVTSHSFAGLISRAADWLITVDPHLHRVSNLREVYSIPAQAVHVAGVVGEWIAGNVSKPLIVGPDDESRQWVERIAAAANAPSIVLRKTRQGDAQVAESAVDLGANAACTPVLVDDIISTGETMAVAIRQLRDQRAFPPVCVGIHAVFANGAWAALKEAGAARVVTTNTIPHASNCIDIVPPLGDALRAQLGG